MKYLIFFLAFPAFAQNYGYQNQNRIPESQRSYYEDQARQDRARQQNIEWQQQQILKEMKQQESDRSFRELMKRIRED